MLVKRATLNDFGSLSGFFIKAWKEAGPGALGFGGATEESIGEISSKEFLRTVLDNSSTPIFIAEDERRIVGFASLKEINIDCVELSGIVVLKHFEGKGIGTRLFKMAKEFAGVKGYKKIVVKTESFNERAIEFYKKMGFSEAGKVVEAVEGTKIDLVELELSI
jgi:ribosomal protein S18 acetylase RimI-like enzyme